MILKTIGLEYTEIDKSTTELIFNVVAARQTECDLIMFTMPDNAEEKIKARIFNNSKKILKLMGANGHISYFAVPDNFLNYDTVCKYVYNKFPDLENALPKIVTGKEFIVVRP